MFFFTSSKLTKVGEEKKRRVDADFKEGGQRNWVQVLSNGGIAAVLVLVLWAKSGLQDKCLDSKDSVFITSLIGGVIGHYACSNGDTWSSELGVLSDSQPRLITTFKVHLLHSIFRMLISLGFSFVFVKFRSFACFDCFKDPYLVTYFPF